MQFFFRTKRICFMAIEMKFRFNRLLDFVIGSVEHCKTSFMQHMNLKLNGNFNTFDFFL